MKLTPIGWLFIVCPAVRFHASRPEPQGRLVTVTPTERLREIVDDALRPHGLYLTREPRPVTGYWKSQDVMRWEAVAASAVRHQDHFSVGSWDTVTACARRGIEIEFVTRREAAIMVYAKEPKSSSQAA